MKLVPSILNIIDIMEELRKIIGTQSTWITAPSMKKRIWQIWVKVEFILFLNFRARYIFSDTDINSNWLLKAWFCLISMKIYGIDIWHLLLTNIWFINLTYFFSRTTPLKYSVFTPEAENKERSWNWL